MSSKRDGLTLSAVGVAYLEHLMTAAAPTHALRASLTVAIEYALGHADVDPLLATSRQPGVDLQANFVMKLVKQLGRTRGRIAEQVTAVLGDVCRASRRRRG